MDLRARDPTIRVGDALEFRCTYDNAAPITLTYGLSAQNEMCGPIVIYTPHNPAAPPAQTWYENIDGAQKTAGGAWQRAPMLRRDPMDVPRDNVPTLQSLLSGHSSSHSG